MDSVLHGDLLALCFLDFVFYELREMNFYF